MADSTKKIVRPFISLLRNALPLKIRQNVAVFVGKALNLKGHSWLSMEIIRDWADTDPSGYNNFLWANHIGFATNYEKVNYFGADNLTKTRVMLFEDLAKYCSSKEIDIGRYINSVFDVGCSSGFLLRYMETNLFPYVDILEGVDIDREAIDKGVAYLKEKKSRVSVSCADITDLGRILRKDGYDMIICAGVLMYLCEEDTKKIITEMLRHANKLVVITSRAHPEIDNRYLEHSVLREDGTMIHNIDSMVNEAGGQIHYRRYEGANLFGGYSVYFVFCSL